MGWLKVKKEILIAPTKYVSLFIPQFFFDKLKSNNPLKIGFERLVNEIEVDEWEGELMLMNTNGMWKVQIEIVTERERECIFFCTLLLKTKKAVEFLLKKENSPILGW